MGIDMINGAGGLYGSYNMRSIPTVDVETVRKQDELKRQEEQNPLASVPEQSSQPSYTEPKASRIADLENISLTFNKEDSFDYLGSESDINGLDMQKAVSDLQKDQVFQEYQYFVGGSGSGMMSSPDGSVFLK